MTTLIHNGMFPKHTQIVVFKDSFQKHY